MAAIRPRKKADGSISYTAQIRIKKNGVQVYTESQTFARKKAAEAWRVQAQTVGNDLSHLGAVLSVAKPAWGYEIDSNALADARRMDWDIPRVASVSGHRDWNSLRRYTHLRRRGDKYAGWKWLTQAFGAPGLASCG